VACALRELGPIFQFLGNPLIIEFLFGVMLSRLPIDRPWFRLGIPFGFLCLALAGFFDLAPQGGTMDFLRGDDGFARITVYGLPAALIVYGFMQIKAAPSMWTVLGDASYALYLTHPFVVAILWEFWKLFPIEANLMIVITSAACVVFAWRIRVRVEKPILAALPLRIVMRQSRS